MYIFKKFLLNILNSSLTNERDCLLWTYLSRIRKIQSYYSTCKLLHNLVPVFFLISSPSASPTGHITVATVASCWSLHMPDIVWPQGLCNGWSLSLEHPSPDTLMANFLAFLRSMFKHHLLYQACPKHPVLHALSLTPVLSVTLTLFHLIHWHCCTHFLFIICHLHTPTRI